LKIAIDVDFRTFSACSGVRAVYKNTRWP